MKQKTQQDIRWHNIAEAIRDKRFEDIADYVWLIIADRVDDVPRKRGPKPKTGIFAGFESISFNRFYTITTSYDNYLENGLSSAEATKTLADDMGLSIKSIEAYLTSYRKGLVETEKINREIERERIIESFNHHYNGVDDPERLLITIRNEAGVNASLRYIAAVIDSAIESGEITFPK